ncbi:phosphatidylserine decarboxylase [Entomophthora muscae]|uniref:Phosphatidylserine decarboxylase n=2 Tax=Entomophthora muscae TaxID=34485 RepID=A0ACC2SNS4_9FUNG|nr:phosphatidylserine decarboxylase [Entomophthora muscae]KAJ9064069.1 phosphatidylserine decarboxylase [Entomophthora muscae]
MPGETTVRVQILQGRDLAPKDSNGLSDPYIVVRLNNKKLNTKTVSETLNPIWNETLSFTFKDDMFPQFIQIICWDADFISRDFMGQITIPIKDLFDKSSGLPIMYEDGKNRQWLRLQTKTQKDIVTGAIELNVGFEPSGKTYETWYKIFKSIGGRISPPSEPDTY